MTKATFALALLGLVIAIIALCHTGEPPKLSIQQASAPCWFSKHPTRPLWRIA